MLAETAPQIRIRTMGIVNEVSSRNIHDATQSTICAAPPDTGARRNRTGPREKGPARHFSLPLELRSPSIGAWFEKRAVVSPPVPESMLSQRTDKHATKQMNSIKHFFSIGCIENTVAFLCLKRDRSCLSIHLIRRTLE
ncbi:MULTISPECIES: hypothetical protein [unclassified Burkholderia]|uniref:hypothetical protein n=1 Tax=unclassified Burkholderia TaxID=2613784 RepID=UPI001E342CD2|nr:MULTISPECIES: hypothetical protein [unclassified Burkholderia]